MQLINNKENLANRIFLIGILLHTLVMSLELGEWSIPYRGRILQLAFVLLCIKILMTWYSKLEWSAMILLGIIGAISYFSGAEEYVLSVVVMIFAAKSTDIRKVIKCIFYITLVVSLATIVLSILGIGGLAVDVKDYGRGGIEARWCLGFGHANNLHGTVWYLVTLFIFLYFEKLNWKHYLLLSILNIGLFFLTVSKAGVAVTQLVIIAACILKYVPLIQTKKWLYFLGLLPIGLFSAISIISVSINWSEHKILLFLDKVLTGRINLAYQHANVKDWHLFLPGGQIGVVDNGWVTIFYNYGYIIGILMIVFYIFLVYASWKKERGIWLISAVSAMLYTFMESTYMLNDAYLLANIGFIVAMIYMGEKTKIKIGDNT